MKRSLLPLLTTACLVSASPAQDTDLDWVPLFNGDDLSGWDAGDKGAELGLFTVVDDVIHLQSDPDQTGGTLSTEENYSNFVLELEFKFGEGRIDSGIMIRGNHDQIQIGESGSLKRDMTASPYIPKKGYPVEAEGVADLLDMEDWNTLRIRAIGGDYTTWLNGEEVMNYSSETAEEEGPIAIQLHAKRNMSIDFRNIRIAEMAGQ